jgi:NAD+ kinase
MVAVHPLFSPSRDEATLITDKTDVGPSAGSALPHHPLPSQDTHQTGDNVTGQNELRAPHIEDEQQHLGEAPSQQTDPVPHPTEPVTSAAPSSLEASQPQQNSGASEEAPLPGPLALKPTKSFLANRHTHKRNVNSIDTVPRQTVMKALASSRSPKGQHDTMASLSGLLSSPDDHNSAPITSRRLSLALSELQAEERHSAISASKFAALASPCFFHNRFDDAVNIEKVLEEIRDDEWLSHSRLMQTATGVREVSKLLQRRPIRRAVRNVMIVTKARDNELVYLTRELTEFLLSTPRYGSDLGVNVYVDNKLKKSRRFNASAILARNPAFADKLRYWTPDLCWSNPETFDLVLTLGGDGTVLFTSWLFQRIVPPVLSFGLGSLGFLTPFKFEEYKNHLNQVMGDQGMRVNLRMRFTCTVYRSQEDGAATPIEAEQFEVLNELVIDRGPSPYVSNLELYGDDNLLTVVQADGCIFSTPTGSTAYSLSAGGSLVHPDIPAVLLTPICPHTLSFRPMMLPDSMLLRVAVPRGSRATAYCAFDGKGRVELRQGDWVEIAASQYPFPSVLSQPTEWFDSLGRTLRWNTRGAQQKAWDSKSERVNPADGAAAAEEPLDDGFDIDFGDDAPDDSGVSVGSSSVAGTVSPVRKNTLTGF